MYALFTQALLAYSVLIGGDSISIGYTTPVTLNLSDTATVERITFENGATLNWQTTAYAIENVMPRLEGRYWDVIHANCGTWDVTTWRGITPEIYEANLRTLVYILKQHCNILIFATTTPVVETATSQSTGRTNARIEEYNTILKRVMLEEGVPVDDLYSAMSGKQEIYTIDNLHFNEAGYDLLAKSVAKTIEEEMNPPMLPISGTTLIVCAFVLLYLVYERRK